MNKIKVAIVGVGYLGQFHAEKYQQLDSVDLVAVCDVDKTRCDEIADRLGVSAIYDFTELSGKVDAVSIATPTSTHHQVALFFLEHHIHMLLEKPITKTLQEADDLIAASKANNCILQIGHLERFNPVVTALDNIIQQPKFIESVRVGPFQARNTDVCVILDLMIHDIDIIQSIVHSPIESIDAVGVSILSNHHDIANARMRFKNGCVANVTASRASLKKERMLRLYEDDAYISVDLQDKILSTHYKNVEDPSGTITERHPVDEKIDVLAEEIAAFIHAIQTNTQPLVSGTQGRQALATALAIREVVK